MQSDQLIDALKKKLKAKNDRELASLLGITGATLSQWRKQKTITPKKIANMVLSARTMAKKLNGSEVLAALRQTLKVKSDTDLADKLGITKARVSQLKNNITLANLSKLFTGAIKQSKKKTCETAIRPIVEFFPVTKIKSARGGKYELFRVKEDNGRDHPYLAGVRDELDGHHGVYIYHDSRGRALYVGKAREQSLWKEMTLVFNRKRDVQKIKRVNHPARRQTYKTTEEQDRQISQTDMILAELTRYVSAYEVERELINELEALLVRSFANDILNVRMEKF